MPVTVLSDRTLGLLSGAFVGGGGPTHTDIEQIWRIAEATAYLPSREDGNKVQRVTDGLERLRSGWRAWAIDLPADPEKLRRVVVALVERLPSVDDRLDAALAADGFRVKDGEVTVAALASEPADRLAEYVGTLFGDAPTLAVARRHYEQATGAFGRGEWESANAQFRSAVEATFEALAHARGCPRSKVRGEARSWLQSNSHLAEDEGKLVQAFMGFASANGSHAGISDVVEAGLRRHFASALVAFATAKLG